MVALVENSKIAGMTGTNHTHIDLYRDRAVHCRYLPFSKTRLFVEGIVNTYREFVSFCFVHGNKSAEQTTQFFDVTFEDIYMYISHFSLNFVITIQV